MILLDDMSWGDGDIAPKLLGTYEEELRDVINKAVGRKTSVVINVGCAEGFYSVGLARLLPETQVFAFDIDPNAQAICRKAAEANGVGGRVVTDGVCSIDALRRLITQNGRALLFIDCEGSELEILNPSLLPETSRLRYHRRMPRLSESFNHADANAAILEYPCDRKYY
jgi:hypothetical protein